MEAAPESCPRTVEFLLQASDWPDEMKETAAKLVSSRADE
jgi:hypothetical protein